MPLLCLCLLALWLPARASEPQVDAQRVKSAIVELDKAWKSDSAAERARAIQANGDLPDPEVVKLVARGLRDKELDVQRAAIEALRFVNHPDALKELQALAHDEKSPKKDPQLLALLLRAIGQYGSASSLHVLGDELGSAQDPQVLQARILGLGRIRTREALERLIEGMKLATAQRGEAAMPDFRLALAVLSGVDQGGSQAAWQNWWNENRAKLKLDEQSPALPRELERKWKVYWGEMQGDLRPRKRSERGQDGSERKATGAK